MRPALRLRRATALCWGVFLTRACLAGMILGGWSCDEPPVDDQRSNASSHSDTDPKDSGDQVATNPSPSPGPTDQITVYAQAAALIKEEFPDRVYGLLPRLWIGAGESQSGKAQDSVLRFKIEDIGDAKAEQVKLRLYFSRGDATANLGELYSCDGTIAWDDRTVTWENAPEKDKQLATLPGFAENSAKQKGGWIEVDITSHVLGDGEFCFRLSRPESTLVAFASNEDRRKPEITFMPVTAEPTTKICGADFESRFAIDEQDYDNITEFGPLKDLVTGKVANLTAAAKVASDAGIDTIYEDLTLKTAGLFLAFAERDVNDTSLATVIGKWNGVGRVASSIEAAAKLPKQELRDSAIILDRALARLVALCARPDARNKGLIAESKKLNIVGPHFQQGGQVVFPYSILGAPLAIDPVFQQLAPIAASIADLETPNSQAPPLSPIRSRLDQIAAAEKRAWIAFDFQTVPRWIPQIAPPVGVNSPLIRPQDPRESLRFVYNFEYALFPIWSRNIANGYARELGSHAAGLSLYSLGTRHEWYSRGSQSGIVLPTEQVRQSFRADLTRKYRNIRRLNQLARTNYSSFLEIQLPSGLALSQKGTFMWHEWLQFNQARVLKMYTELCNEASIAGQDDNALCFVSPSSDTLSTPPHEHDHGLNRVELARAFGAAGISSRFRPRSEGGIEWQEGARNLDFIRSFAPAKLRIDTEWRALMDDDWRESTLTAEYTSVALWISYLFGMSSHQTAHWARQADGSPSADETLFRGAITTQPLVMDAHLRTMAEINALSSAVATIANASPRVAIFYSESSAIQSRHFFKALNAVHEVLSTRGYTVGFVTETELGATAADDKIETLIIPAADHVTESEITAIERFAASGGQVFRVGDNTLRYAPSGTPHIGIAIDNVITISAFDNETLRSNLNPRVQPLGRCLGADGNQPSIKLICRSAEAADGGILTAVINPTHETVRYQLGTEKPTTVLRHNASADVKALSVGPLSVQLFLSK